MQVTADFVLVAPDHQAHLRVDFVSHQAIDDVHAGFLELPRPLDIVRFIEARPQFHDRAHLFALVHRLHQRADDSRIAPGAIKGLLDGQDARVFRRLFQETHHAVEVFVRMVQQNIALANHREQVRLVPQRRRDRPDKRRVAQFGRVIPFVNPHQPDRVQRSLD